MSKPTRTSYLVPAGALLLALLLSITIGPGHAAMTFRSTMSHTGGGGDCEITKVEILPILQQETVDFPIEDIEPATGETVEHNNFKMVLGKPLTEKIFDPNPARGGGHRLYVGQVFPGDDSNHDHVLVKVEGTAKVAKVLITVDSMDVDDPSAIDPPHQNAGGGANPVLMARFKDIEKEVGARARNPVKSQIHDIYCGGHVANQRGPAGIPQVLPTLEWDNLVFDNRTISEDVPPSGIWMFEAALKTGTGDRPGLSQKELNAIESMGLTPEDLKSHHVGQNRPAGQGEPHTHVELEIQCDRATASVTVVDGAFKKYFLLRTPRQPGDNIRIAAVCTTGARPANDADDILKPVIPLQKDTLARMVLRKEVFPDPPPPPDPRAKRGRCRDGDISWDPLPNDKIKVSDQLTVWRRVHFELDAMEGMSKKKYPKDTFEDTKPNEATDVDVAIRSKIMPDIFSLLPADPPAPQPPPPPNLTNPPPAGSLTLMSAAFIPQYIEPIRDLPLQEAPDKDSKSGIYNPRPIKKFERNLNMPRSADVMKEAKEIFDTEPENFMYWLIHLWGAYEGSTGESNDPEPPPGVMTLDRILAGITGGQGGGDSTSGVNLVEFSKYRSSAAMFETIRDVAAVNRDSRFNNPPTAGTVVKDSHVAIIQRCYVHETGHQFLDRIDHEVGGWMWPHVVWVGTAAADRAGLGQRFAEKHQALIRAVGSP